MNSGPPEQPGERPRAPLAGRRVVTTREVPGRLDELLRALGAEVVHVPLIEIAEAPERGVSLAGALASIHSFDWVVATSRHGAERVADAIPTEVRTAAVGTATAEVLEQRSGRPVDLVPGVQRATGLVAAFAKRSDAPPGGWTILVAQVDRAEPTLVDGLRALGHTVEVRTAYSTRLRTPSAVEVELALAADAVAFASGSAAEAWAATIGRRTPPVVCVIGPTTARVARLHGIEVTAEAVEHSVEGLASSVANAVGRVF
ncbi:uroporphyrinogen-III synthase [soil metagenome]